jgi:hypothetical protein
LKFRFYNSILNNKLKNNFLLNPNIIQELTKPTKYSASIFQLLGEMSPLIKKIEFNSLNLFDVFTNIIKNTDNSFINHHWFPIDSCISKNIINKKHLNTKYYELATNNIDIPEYGNVSVYDSI